MQGRAGQTLGRGQPGEHSDASELALGDGFTEQYPGRLVADPDLDADSFPVIL